jgi:hypothetical protein
MSSSVFTPISNLNTRMIDYIFLEVPHSDCLYSAAGKLWIFTTIQLLQLFTENKASSYDMYLKICNFCAGINLDFNVYYYDFGNIFVHITFQTEEDIAL